MKMEHERKAMTVEDVIKCTGYSRNYIYKLVYLKKLPYFKPMGGRLFFKLEDVENFVFRNRQTANYEQKNA